MHLPIVRVQTAAAVEKFPRTKNVRVCLQCADPFDSSLIKGLFHVFVYFGNRWTNPVWCNGAHMSLVCMFNGPRLFQCWRTCSISLVCANQLLIAALVQIFPRFTWLIHSITCSLLFINLATDELSMLSVSLWVLDFSVKWMFLLMLYAY